MGADRLRELVDVLLDLDAEGDADVIARRAFLSRFHFDRLVAAGLGEPPAAFRRRLLLERAAWTLRRGDTGVLDAAIAAGYGSGEAFARAFRRAYGCPPSRFAGDHRLPAPNGIHFHPPAGLLFAAPNRRSTAMTDRAQRETSVHGMDLIDRMLEHDLEETRSLFASADGLDGELLDLRVRPGHRVLAEDEETVRTMLEHAVWSREVWLAAIDGEPFPQPGGRSVDDLRARLERSGPAFVRRVRRIRDEGRWDDVFVDALCEPPQSFSLGGVVAHVLTFAAHRRQLLAEVLTEVGVQGVTTGCPLDWELTWGAA